jgi:hypothetical protein
MKRIHNAIIMLSGTTVLAGAMLFTVYSAPSDAVPALAENEIIARIRAKISPLYEKYAGIECLREITSMQYDSRDNTFLESYTVLLRRREYFYRKADYKVLKYIKDGKEKPRWYYNFPTRKPVHQLFDRDMDKNYAVKLLGKKSVNNVECWEIDVIPQKKTPRHMKGKAYFTVKDLDLFCLEGTIADNPTGLQSLYLKIFFKRLDDAYCMSTGTYILMVHVPIFYPHRKMVQTFSSSEERLIPAKKKP